MARNPHDRVVTPETDPGRFTPEEAAAFRRGVCSRTGYGSTGGDICGVASRQGASFGDCPEHAADLLMEHWPDGTRRPQSDLSGPAYDRRVQAAVDAHQQQCADPGCFCRTP